MRRMWRLALVATFMVVALNLQAEDEKPAAPDAASAPDAAPAADLETESGVLTEAKRLFRRRELGFGGKNTDALIELLEKGTRRYAESYELHWRLAQVIWWKSDGTRDKDIKGELGKRAKAAGDVARALKPKDVKGHYFAAIGTGAWAQGMGLFSAITKGVDGEFTSRLDAAIELDRTFECGGPMLSKGRYYFELPWPKYDGDESIEWLEKVIALCPGNARPHFYLAETLWKEDEEDRAREQLKIGLAVDPKKCFSAPECRRAQKQARWLIEEFE